MYNIFYENIILIPGVSFGMAVIIKGLIVKIKTWKLDINRALWSWGMPSVHTAVVISLAMAFALKYGVQSDYFAIVMAYTAIIIYDAINVRFEAGLHAQEINKSIWEKKFKESLGHLPSEAFAWSVLGVIVAVVLFYV